MDASASIIVPVYNVEQYLEKCLESVLGQTFPDYDVIAIDDGSTDASGAILAKFAKTHPQLKVITQENQGLSAARNTGIDASSATYIAFVDSDDYISTDFLKKMVGKAEASGADIVIARYEQFAPDGTVLSRSRIGAGLPKEALFCSQLAAKSSAMACDKLVRRSLFVEHDIRFPVGLYHEDVATTFKLFYFAKGIQVIEDHLYFWLRRDKSISKSITEKHIGDIYRIFEITRDFLIQEGILEQYQQYYLRRCYHFTLGLMNRIGKAEVDAQQRAHLLATLREAFVSHGLAEVENVKQVLDYDPAMMARMANEMLSTMAGDFAAGSRDCNLKVLEFEAQFILSQAKLQRLQASRGHRLLQNLYKIRDKLLLR